MTIRINPKYFQTAINWKAVEEVLWEMGELAGVDEAERQSLVSEIMLSLEKSFE